VIEQAVKGLKERKLQINTKNPLRQLRRVEGSTMGGDH
jgi:hypothetical protein